jgi:hypothetical protein
LSSELLYVDPHRGRGKAIPQINEVPANAQISHPKRHNLPALPIAYGPTPIFDVSRSACTCAWHKLPGRKGCAFGVHYISGLLQGR